jgi:hypothetical protein
VRRAGGDSLFLPFSSRGWRYASFESLYINGLRLFCADRCTELCRTVQNCAEQCTNETVNGALANQLICVIPARRRPGRAALVLIACWLTKVFPDVPATGVNPARDSNLKYYLST